MKSIRLIAALMAIAVFTGSGAGVSTAGADEVIGGVTIEAQPRMVELRVDDQTRVTQFTFGGHKLKCKGRRIKAGSKAFKPLRNSTSGNFSHSERFTRRAGTRVYIHQVSFSGETLEDHPTSWVGGFKHRVTVKRRNGPTLDRCEYEGAWIASA